MTQTFNYQGKTYQRTGLTTWLAHPGQIVASYTPEEGWKVQEINDQFEQPDGYKLILTEA